MESRSRASPTMEEGTGAWSRSRKLAVAAIAMAPATVLAAGHFGTDGDDRESLLAHLLFWSMPCLLGFVAVAAVWWWRGHRAARTVQVGAVLPWVGYAVAVTALLFLLVPPRMRVQFDESTLVGISMNMQRAGLAVVTTGAIPFEGEVVALENTVDKRPPLFPFLVHLVHRTAGVRIANAFAVQFVLMVLGLFFLSVAVKARLGVAAALAVPPCIIGVPVIGIAATSAGFESMATVWLIVAALATLEFCRRPDDARLAGLLASVVLLAHSRYESPLAAAALGCFAARAARRRYRPSFRAALLLACVPALVTPLALLLQHTQGARFHPEASGGPIASLAHFGEHLGPFAAAWFDPSPASPLLGALAILGMLVWGVRVLRREATIVDAVVALPVACVTVVALAWFYGDVREPAALRLFLPFAWLAALVPLCGFAWFGRRGRIALLVLLAVHAAVRLRGVYLDRMVPEDRIAALTAVLDEVLAQTPGRRETTLWVTTVAQYPIVFGHAALSPASFSRHTADLQQLCARGDLETIYVLETTVDDQLAPGLGSPADVLRRWPSDIVLHGERIIVRRLR